MSELARAQIEKNLNCSSHEAIVDHFLAITLLVDLLNNGFSSISTEWLKHNLFKDLKALVF